MSFSEYIEFARDSYFGFLTPKKHRTLQRALINLQSVSFVYLTENLDADLTLFLRYLDAQLEWRATRRNATRHMKVTREHRAAVKRHRPQDYAIYEAAQKLNRVQRAYFAKHRRQGLVSDLDWSGVIV